MSEEVLQMPGYRYYEYLLVLQPHEELRNRILNQRKDFSAAYQAIPTSGGKPHVLLAKFMVWQMMEEKILNRLKLITMGFPPFRVQLHNFGSFPSHTIYFDVATRLPFQSLSSEVKKIRRLLKSPDQDPFFPAEFYIPLARKIPSVEFDNAWKEYSQKHFTGSFIADGMLVLKRRHGDRAYQIVKRLDFMNLPVITKQGKLFSTD
jgi:2'-5' RNA ligase